MSRRHFVALADALIDWQRESVRRGLVPPTPGPYFWELVATIEAFCRNQNSLFDGARFRRYIERRVLAFNLRESSVSEF